MLRIVDFYGTNTDDFASLAGPGRWNDPDMLIIGNFGLSLEQVICITWLSLTSLNWSKYAHYRAESWTGNNDDHHQSHEFYQRVMTILSIAIISINQCFQVLGSSSCFSPQSKAQMGMWCMLAAPLIMSNDLRTLRLIHLTLTWIDCEEAIIDTD